MKKEIHREKHTLDATGQSLGRLASEIAILLRGKHKASYEPHMDCGDFVVVQNMNNIVITGNKEEQEMYYRYSGYPGGIKARSLKELKNDKPEELLKMVVRKMMPKNKLRPNQLKRLTIE